MAHLLKKIRDTYRAWAYNVLLDPRDNSVTLSKRLFTHMRRNTTDGKAKVFVFYVPAEDTFAFTANHGIEQETVLCDIQYNGRYHCVGFETLCPSVGYILQHYGLPADKQLRTSVSVRKAPNGFTYYQLDRIYDKHTGKDKEA